MRWRSLIMKIIKSLFNVILLQLYGSESTIEWHDFELEWATLWTI